MEVRVGLTTKDLTSLLHASVSVTCADKAELLIGLDHADSKKVEVAPGTLISFSAKNSTLSSNLPGLTFKKDESARILSAEHSYFVVNSLRRTHGVANIAPSYRGTLELVPAGNVVRVILICDLEEYLEGVLQSEMPASYHIEAVMCQAIAARTYALRPRINHALDLCTVCDSYMCCQYFAGVQKISARHALAIQKTANQILTYQDKPILALFSSCSGGCTEDYESCFSDPLTQAFPPAPLPYLRSASESTFEPNLSAVTEEQIRKLWQDKSNQPVDAWSNQYRWQVTMPASELEAHLHHQIETMRQEQVMAPFIVAPAKEQFGHIKEFQVKKRGRGGVAIELCIATSTGTWTVKKELVIRSIFENPALKLKRLKSAKLYFDHDRDQSGFLSKVTVTGLGWGHGVGMQQTGAQGWALRGKKCAEILLHYFENAQIEHT